MTQGLSGTASFTSSSFQSQKIVRLSCQITISSGSFVGTVQLQGSNDQAPSNNTNLPFQPTNWSVIGSQTSVTSSTTTAGSGVLMMPSTEVSYEYLRIVFTDGSAGAAVGRWGARVKSMGL